MSTVLRARVELLPTSAGGRRSGVVNGYRPDAVVGDGPYHGIRLLMEEGQVLEPGESAELDVELRHTDLVEYAGFVSGTTFEIREGSRTVARGVFL